MYNMANCNSFAALNLDHSLKAQLKIVKSLPSSIINLLLSQSLILNRQTSKFSLSIQDNKANFNLNMLHHLDLH
ncbi:hypothetical protein D7V32_05785 [Acinetobacter tianfuensis]|uniref:Uncharacterized protein n=1 Tax=Acinetobacter tianfuensis TaxID=2419603 RepID=A0A3A8EC40_9GAMM|nr:hypothetical protein D7V32_05785 [Acinetobacter tianfuensis]